MDIYRFLIINGKKVGENSEMAPLKFTVPLDGSQWEDDLRIILHGRPFSGLLGDRVDDYQL